MLDIDGEPITFEVVPEGRIELETPHPGDNICGVATLTELGTAAGQLQPVGRPCGVQPRCHRPGHDAARPDRLRRAIAKAESAYGSAVVDDLSKAIDHLRDNPHHLDDCMRELQTHETPKAVLWARIKQLSP